jgi:hypothetical protein
LHPRRALIDQRLVQPHPFAPLQHHRRRDPRRRQPAIDQQVAQQPTVGAVGLGVPLAASRCLRIGRLRQMRLEAGCDHLLDDVTPTSATLHRDRHRAAMSALGDVVAQPPSEPLPIGLPHPAGPDLTGLHLHCIERDLRSMQIQATYHRHRGPPSSSTGTWQTKSLPEPEPARSPHMGCSGTVGRAGAPVQRVVGCRWDVSLVRSWVRPLRTHIRRIGRCLRTVWTNAAGPRRPAGAGGRHDDALLHTMEQVEARLSALRILNLPALQGFDLGRGIELAQQAGEVIARGDAGCLLLVATRP